MLVTKYLFHGKLGMQLISGIASSPFSAVAKANLHT